MKYTVRLEFDINSIDFGDVAIEATSPEEAKQIAIFKYFNTNELDIDYYASEAFDSTLRANDSDNWLVEKVEESRICTTCGKKMAEGYCAGDGEEYYCSDECLFVDGYTPEQRDKDYENGHIYYTEWETPNEN